MKKLLIAASISLVSVVSLFGYTIDDFKINGITLRMSMPQGATILKQNKGEKGMDGTMSVVFKSPTGDTETLKDEVGTHSYSSLYQKDGRLERMELVANHMGRIFSIHRELYLKDKPYSTPILTLIEKQYGAPTKKEAKLDMFDICYGSCDYGTKTGLRLKIHYSSNGKLFFDAIDLDMKNQNDEYMQERGIKYITDQFKKMDKIKTSAPKLNF